MARFRKSDRQPRPKQGAHLLTLRQATGLTQVQLADFLGVPQGTIAFWEWSDKPPRSNVLPALAAALRVKVEYLLLTTSTKKPPAISKKRGPVSEVQKAFETVSALPRHQQRKIVETVQALVNEYGRKAS